MPLQYGEAIRQHCGMMLYLLEIFVLSMVCKREEAAITELVNQIQHDYYLLK